MAAAAIIPAAIAAVSTGANMIQTGKLNKKGREFTEAQNALNRQQTWDMWNATNDFNLMTSDPAFQMQRWKEAGLNPHLMYGNPQDVKASNLSTQQFAPPEQKGVDFRGAVQDFYAGVMQKKQLEAMDATISKTRAEEANVNQNTLNSQFDLNAKETLFPTVQGTAEAELTGKIYSNNKIVEEIAKIGSEMQMNQQQIKNMQATVSKTMIEIDQLKKQGKLADAELEAKTLANQLFRNTMKSEADAKNAENELIKKTGGMSKTGAFQLPGAIIGHALQMIKNTLGQPEKLKKAFKQDMKRIKD